ncbi:hypothetical protein AAFF_G00274690 [Aldrovandia affinis]|uniref:Uncharacterized protein n=1 Tax=Aldrovandia affinis TaxID=143900 RepID=A0AAD7SRP8_9TELE|nr:hypothetical protein AAFF_G00274690 [Aldrovandia affinis]
MTQVWGARTTLLVEVSRLSPQGLHSKISIEASVISAIGQVPILPLDSKQKICISDHLAFQLPKNCFELGVEIRWWALTRFI